ncbi:sensor histidine kinase [Bacterioplanoides pacificum]|uniref:histidine kinase n=1 Tax=Bacterioplanoides pacificum TaxID=1171596 RepID=A0ABV7VPX0_9GAMM
MKFEQLLAAVVHDLKNQLQSLLDFEQDALSRIPAQYHQELWPILQRTNRLKNDSLQLITLYRFHEDGRFPMDDAWPKDTISDAIEATSLQFPTIRFHNLASDDCQGFYSETLVQLALVTLITNSAQAGATEIKISADDSGDQLLLEVNDNGPGFADDILSGEAETTKAGPGGLGLYFVELIAQHHQQHQRCGSVTIGNRKLMNQQIGGAQVKLYLP